MTDTTHTGAEAPPEPKPVGVAGWNNTLEVTDPEPAVIINPKASAAALCAWGAGQLESVNELLSIIGCSDVCGDYADFSGAIRNITEQVQIVLDAAMLRAEGEADHG